MPDKSKYDFPPQCREGARRQPVIVPAPGPCAGGAVVGARERQLCLSEGGNCSPCGARPVRSCS